MGKRIKNELLTLCCNNKSIKKVFEKNPTKGGIPANEKKINAFKKDKALFLFERNIKLEKNIGVDNLSKYKLSLF